MFKKMLLIVFMGTAICWICQYLYAEESNKVETSDVIIKVLEYNLKQFTIEMLPKEDSSIPVTSLIISEKNLFGVSIGNAWIIKKGDKVITEKDFLFLLNPEQAKKAEKKSDLMYTDETNKIVLSRCGIGFGAALMVAPFFIPGISYGAIAFLMPGSLILQLSIQTSPDPMKSNFLKKYKENKDAEIHVFLTREEAQKLTNEYNGKLRQELGITLKDVEDVMSEKIK